MSTDDDQFLPDSPRFMFLVAMSSPLVLHGRMFLGALLLGCLPAFFHFLGRGLDAGRCVDPAHAAFLRGIHAQTPSSALARAARAMNGAAASAPNFSASATVSSHSETWGWIAA